jgi:hypothetical protein
MRPTFRLLAVLVAFVPAAALAGGSRTYLVPAVVQCPGPAACVPRQFESAYTFDAIILVSSGAKYLSPNKPSLTLEIRGVRDPSHALFTGNLTLQLLPSRVSLPGIGTFPDDSPLTAVAPATVPVKNGAAHFPYKPSAAAPNGTITNGGGVEVLDPDGKRLAVTGSQAKP